MARNKRSASPERAKKKRKVVLVKAQAAAEQRGREEAEKAAKATEKNLSKKASIPGGTAGRLLQYLGHGPRPGSKPERAETQVAEVEKEKPKLVVQKASVRATKQSSPNKTTKKGSKCVPESDSESSSDSRSSSPSPSPSPIMAPAVVPPAKVAKRPKGASPKKEASKAKVKKRAAPPPALAAPVKAKKINDGSSVPAAAPAKSKKTAEAPAPVKVKKSAPEKAAVKPPAPAPVTTQPELSELDHMGLQDAVLERLRSLCDKDVDPKVLAEYIVVLAQMNKGPDHLSGELEAFFSDKALLQSFVRWVEDSKWSFVPGGQPLKPVRSAQAGKGAQQVDFRGPADTNGTARLAKNVEATSAGPKTVRQGPHVAVTSRVVLQPNPNFDATPPPVAKAPISSPIKSPMKSPISKAPGPRMMPYMMPPPRGSAEAQQVQLLGEFTKTLQTILTKLQNPELDDSQRERYQAMADKIHNKIKTIKLATSTGPVRRR